MPKRKKSRSKLKRDPFARLPPLNLNAAGIDVASAEHFVAVPPDRDSKPVRRFDCFTADLHRLADSPKRKKSRSKLKRDPFARLPPLNLNAAGIDVASAEHFVAVPPDRDSKPVRRFDCFTADLHRLAEAEILQYRHGRHGIYRQLLDSFVSSPGSSCLHRQAS